MRVDVEAWLSKKHTQAESRQASILLWPQIAGWAGVVSVVAAFDHRR
jgi:hypothetical protein